MRGRLVDLSFSRDRKQRLTIEVDDDFREQYDKLHDEDIDLTVKIYREKRSLDANAYYWQLLTKLSEAVGVSKPRMHNELLRRYGQAEMIDEQMVYIVLPDTDEAERKAIEAEKFHIKPTSQVKEGRDGRMYRTYFLLRGSHTYDSREMSVLINGLCDECHELNIETLTPDELAKLKGLEDAK